MSPSDQAPSVITLPVPVVPALLPDDPQWDETGLLPATDAYAPLPVEVPAWEHTPISGRSTILRVYWTTGASHHPVYEKQWPSDAYPDIPPQDLLFQVPVVRLAQGEHQLWYELTTPSEFYPHSLEQKVTIDLTAPVLGNNSGRLIFDTDTITEQYLIDHGDQLLGQVPVYPLAAPGDVITWYWSRDPQQVLPADEVASRPLPRGTVQPISLAFAGQMIRDRGDGERYACYQLKDRAGNTSPYSNPVRLTVRAQPVGRVLPPPTVAEAVGSGSQSSLNPDSARSGATVVIAPEAVLKPGDVIEVFWATPGTHGAYQTDDAEAERRYKVPAEYVPAHMGTQIAVYYRVSGNGPDEESQHHTLSVQQKGSGWPTIQCTRPTIASGRLSLATVIDHATFRLPKWMFMAAEQRLTISLLASGATRVLLDDYRITQGDVDAAHVSTNALKSLLEGLPLGALTVQARVSFDGGSSTVTFPTLNLQLVA
ncbi:putative uncharacterized protein [Pseudomonas sp. StFLB209]|uniref:hypothetical protein n=1 Tax=Pseudomonas sp. StFLB209 TaxID=1028989 RepID=UPI0004F83B44|nr:hypothetical protein [Pseudomonas sp. StFLB209]BAP44560.1 putative uncharacterized protein [Pseudomonas sp. StFLB209]